MTQRNFTLPQSAHFVTRETDGGHFVTSADKSTDPTEGDGVQLSESTGLVWFAYRDGMTAGRIGMLPADARQLAADLLAAANATDDIMREKQPAVRMVF